MGISEEWMEKIVVTLQWGDQWRKREWNNDGNMPANGELWYEKIHRFCHTFTFRLPKGKGRMIYHYFKVRRLNNIQIFHKYLLVILEMPLNKF